MKKKRRKYKTNQPTGNEQKNKRYEWVTILIIVLLALLGLISSYLFFMQSNG